MEKIFKVYHQGCYAQCISELKTFKTSSLMQELIVRNNILVAEFQICHSNKNSLEKHLITQEFIDLWSNTSSLQHDQTFSSIQILCLCNMMYCILDEQPFLNVQDEDVKSLKVSMIFNEFLLVLASRCQILVKDPIVSKETESLWLVREIILSKKLSEEEILLFAYSCLLRSLITFDDNHIASLEEVLQPLRNLTDITHANCDCIFFLHPTEISLQSNEGNIRTSVLNDFLKLCLMLFHCRRSLFWHKTDRPIIETPYMENVVLSEISKLLNMYSVLKADNEALEIKHSNHSNTLFHQDIKHLHFGAYLLEAAKFALMKKPFASLKMLKYSHYASNEILSHTKACSIIMSYSATQFKALKLTEFEIQSWKIAEESLINSPEYQFSIHSEICGFVLARLGLLSLPKLSCIRYQLARTLLESQKYQEAADIYEHLHVVDSDILSESNDIFEAFKLSVPSKAIVFHEYVLALLLGKMTEKALTVVESGSCDDFLVSFLHAEIFSQLQNHKQAIDYMKRSITQLNSTSIRNVGMKNIIMSRIRITLAQLCIKVENNEDAFHQLRLSVQHGVINENVKELAVKLNLNLEVDTKDEVLNVGKKLLEVMEKCDDFTIHYVMGGF